MLSLSGCVYKCPLISPTFLSTPCLLQCLPNLNCLHGSPAMRSSTCERFAGPTTDSTDFHCRRVRLYSLMGDTLHGATAIDCLRPGTTWGLDEFDTVLCDAGIPVNITVVRVYEGHEVKHCGDHIPALYTTVNLMRDCDRAGLVSLLKRENPPLGDYINLSSYKRKVSSCIPASSQYIKNYSLQKIICHSPGNVLTYNCFDDLLTVAIPQVFPTILDGTTSLIPSGMPSASWDSLRRGDVVLLECGFKRNMIGPSWSTHFVINRLTIIQKAPVGAM